MSLSLSEVPMRRIPATGIRRVLPRVRNRIAATETAFASAGTVLEQGKREREQGLWTTRAVREYDVKSEKETVLSTKRELAERKTPCH